MKKTLFTALVIALLIAGWFWLSGSDEVSEYRTASITRGDITEAVTSTGTLDPIEMVTVGTQVSGQVQHVYVHVNDQVKEGQLLADIDPSLLEAQLKQDQSGLETALVNYEQADRDVKRTRMLLAKDYVAEIDLEHAEQTYFQTKNAYESAQTQVDRDKVNLGYAKITAPINGTVISQDVTIGQTVAASFQTPNLFKIAGDLTKMKISVNLSEADIGRVKMGLPVTFTVDAFPDRQFIGSVKSIDLNPNTQQGVVTYTVVVAVENKDGALLPGMTAYVSIRLSEAKQVLRVPAAALRFVPPPEHHVSGIARLLRTGFRNHPAAAAMVMPLPGKNIYLLRGGVPVPVPVTTGLTDDTFIQVSGEGIHEGDIVVTGLLMAGRH